MKLTLALSSAKTFWLIWKAIVSHRSYLRQRNFLQLRFNLQWVTPYMHYHPLINLGQLSLKYATSNTDLRSLHNLMIQV